MDFWAVPETWIKLREHFHTSDDEVILQHLNIDIRQFQPDYIGPELRVMEDGSFFDTVGIHRKLVYNGKSAYEEYASSPLGYAESVEDLDKYEYWPSADNYDWDGLSAKIGDAHDKYYIKLETGGIFELSWALRGYEQFLMDMLLEPEMCAYILNKFSDFYCDYVTRALTACGDKIDMIYTYDDIASQRSLLMSKDTWEELIKPCHVKLNKVIRSFGKTIMYHSCGAVYDMIENLVQLPIDVLNPLQPRAAGMDFNKIKENFGSRICFHGGIDIQETLPFGTPDDVRKEVGHAIGTLSQNGGYILSSAHYIQGDTPVENILAMYRAAVDYGPTA